MSLPAHNHRQCLLRGIALCLLSLVCTFFATGSQRAAAEQTNRCWALLIGVERYQLASPLRHTLNDVHQLAQTLRDRGNVPENQILQITDDAENARFQPLRESLLAELPRWLEQPGPEDQVVVYFSGHGFRDNEGRMYLAPIDCDPSNAAATGIPVEWFREQIAACRGKFKLMIIDSCHAGSEKGETSDEKSIAAKDLAEPFRDLGDVVTLASSTGDQKSQIWEDRKQSLFTYWLNEGLKGHADENDDNQIDVDELNKYVHRNVVRTAQRHFPREQTPVRIVRTGVPGSPVVVNLRPLGLKDVLNDMAEQLAWGLEDHKLNRVAVLEFTNDTPLGELLGANFGLVGRYCAESLEKRLMDLGEDKYTIVDRRRLQNALSAQNFGIEDLASPEALNRLSSQSGGLPVLALGTLRSRVGRVVNLQCKLFATDTGDLIASAGGVAQLNEHEWAMLGQSARVEVDPIVLAPPPRIDETPAAPVDEVAMLVNHLDQQSTKSHPLSDRSFPFRVTLYVDGKRRDGVFRGNDLLVPVRRGEKYSIHVENQSGELVMMRLLVDGLNTLPQPEQVKGVTTMLMAQRVHLEDARAWILDPKVSKVFGVRGFISTTGDEGSLREFIITDAASSVAARQQFTDQIGLITAAFYRPASSTRGSLGTGLGEERREEIEERQGYQVGDLLAVVNIRYVDADELNQ